MRPPLTEDDRLATLALIELTQVGPARFRWLCSGRSPAEALDALVRGDLPRAEAPPRVSERLVERWGNESRRVRPTELADRYRDAGVSILYADDPAWPFGDDPEPPAVLFYRGNLSGLANPGRVCVIGTRHCTSIGRTVAQRLGRELSLAGVGVVSGLALGIDGEAHAGALSGRRDGGETPIGVVGTGIDVVYPRTHAVLWEEVARHGLLLSEAPLGAGPQRWRFPARNRLLASLSRLVVVVESHAKGGSLLTVASAIERNVDVGAVPGSVLARSSDGANNLLVEGAIPIRGAADVLGYLGLDTSREARRATNDPEARPGPSPPAGSTALGLVEAAVLEQVLAGGGHLDRLMGSVEGGPAELMGAVQSLVTRGLVVTDGSTVVATPEAGWPGR